MNPMRRLAYRFLQLPYHKKIKIASALGLVERESDQNLRDAELFQKFFQRAKEQQKLPALWDQVESQYADGEKSNPFTQKGYQ